MAWLFRGTEAELLSLAERDFIEVWSCLFGGPPAAMLDRADMIDLMRSALEPCTAGLVSEAGSGRAAPVPSTATEGREPRR
jgi:hypothetical protein